RTNPFLRELMETFLKVGGRRGKAGGPGIDFDELGVSEVVQLLDDANMEAVVLDFGDKNPQEDPVIHFYELFLKEYDAKKRMQRGVFYTPRPVVSYIVRSVDELLRTEFGLEDGLADTTTWGEMAKRRKDLKIPEGTSPDQAFVQILDPATGTGTFLVEVIDIIHKTMVAKWKAQGHGEKKIASLWNEYVPKHLLTRLHAYELLMAPYAIAHLKVGLKLYETGYRFGSDERARIYLTNALEPAQDFSGTFEFAIPALAHEAQAVNGIKRKQQFTVVIGNPPYSNFGMMNKMSFIMKLLEDYKRGLAEKKLNLDDDFIKFIRFGQYLIGQTGVGLLAFITNNTYIDGITHRQMRRSLLDAFHRVSIVNLHGSSSKKESCPDGSKDENVFDIQQGVGISILVAGSSSPQPVRHTDIWGTREHKYECLLRPGSLGHDVVDIQPHEPQFFFVPKDFSGTEDYMRWPSLVEVFITNGPGVKTERDGVSIHWTRNEIEDAVQLFRLRPDTELRKRFGLGSDSRDWKVANAKADVTKHGSDDLFRRILYRPFDYRHTWYSGKTRGFIGTPGYPVMKNMLAADSLGLLAMRQFEYDVPEYCYFLATPTLTECRVFVSNRGIANIFPLYLSAEPGGGLALLGSSRATNFQQGFIRDLASELGLGVEADGLPSGLTPESIFAYAYAVFHSPGYRQDGSSANRHPQSHRHPTSEPPPSHYPRDDRQPGEFSR
ncbi:MAG: DNA methyltransferase, partial [Proteobacteria bacterium]|nr:DNA methyltransferase [Pseudomonadota bacterium]